MGIKQRFRQWRHNRRVEQAFDDAYKNKRYEEIIWLIGDGRSGTTWVSELLNHDGRYREVFEPVHPKKIEPFSFIAPHQYQRPGSQNPQLEAALGDLFSGKFRHPRTDFYNRSYAFNGLLIKDIFANLLGAWAVEQFPAVRPVYLVRNPFAVALSKRKKSNWFWLTDPAELLQQPELREDYLQPYETLIRKTSEQNDFILSQILIWAIIHDIPARQFAGGGAHFLFYEQMFTNPLEELGRVLQFVRNATEPVSVELDESVINKPSRVSGKDSTLSGSNSPLLAWKNELPAATIDQGLEILETFGMAELYGDDGMPQPAVLLQRS